MANNKGAAKRIASGRKPEDPARVNERRRRNEEKKRQAQRAAERAKRMTTGEAVALYREERDKWLERTAAQRAELQQRIRDAVAKADAEDLVVRRGGRPKGQKSTGKNRGPSIAVFGRSKLDLLRESRPGGTL